MPKGKSRKPGEVPPLPTSVQTSGAELGTSDPAKVGARIAEVRGRASQDDFGRELGVHANTLGRYERGERLPDADFLTAMAARRNVSTHWLLYGIPPKLLSESVHPELRRLDYWKMYTRGLGAEMRAAEPPAPGYIQIPLYDVRAGAGRGKVVESEHIVDALAFKEDWIRQELRASPADLRLINVSGDSMEPDLRAGDIILIDHTDTRASREGIYVIRMDGALLVKQLQRLPGGTVKVISRNQAYEPFTVPVASLEEANGFAIIGRVVWACRRL